jgi:hypothetical protein
MYIYIYIYIYMLVLAVQDLVHRVVRDVGAGDFELVHAVLGMCVLY